jgi:hypothetical protein
MGKTMCKEKKKKLRKKEDKKSKYSCKKCGEESLKEKHLCKPKKI